jgi:hypothetical protein
MNKRLAVVVANGAVLASLLVYMLQLSFFAKLSEQLVYGAYGAVWYVFLYRAGRGAVGKLDALLIAMLGAVGLGFSPHRLRLGLYDSPDVIYSTGNSAALLLLFPLIHFVLTALFLWRRPTKQSHGEIS